MAELDSDRRWPRFLCRLLGCAPAGFSLACEHRGARLRCLGNALVPQIAEWIGRRILEWEGVT